MLRRFLVATISAGFAAMFEKSTEMMALYDVDGRVVKRNRAAKRSGLVVAADQDGIFSRAFAAALGGQANEFATVLIDGAGRRVPVIANLSPIVVGGRTVGVVGAARDVSAEQQYEEQLLHNRERFRALFEQSTFAMASLKPDGTISAINVAMERLSGYRNEEVVGKSALMFAPKDRLDIAQERLAGLAVKPQALSYESMLLCRGDHEVPIGVDVLPIRVMDRVEGFYMTIKDLTHERALAGRLTEKDHRFSALYRVASSSSSASVQLDEALAMGADALGMTYGFVTETHDGRFTIRHRYGPEDGSMLVGASEPSLRSIGERLATSPRALAIEDRDASWKSCIGSRIAFRGETYGALIFLDTKLRESAFEQADIDFIDLMVALVSGAVAREIDERELHEHSLRDPLTGLANRLKLEQEITRTIARARRSQDRFALHFVDLDRFKPINDQWGHEAGDAVLRQIAVRLGAILRSGDLLARIGGDEFVVLQTGLSDASSTGDLDERIGAAVRAPVHLDQARTVSVGCSIGVSVFPQDGTVPSALMRAADAAMYRAKERGRSTAT
jgi:diguanylate cyclase (GGDEF)-like protein/PAS domain S-box-containing protein